MRSLSRPAALSASLPSLTTILIPCCFLLSKGWGGLGPEVAVPFETPLSDEIVTACCCLLLSEEGFRGIFGSDPSLLDCKVIFEEPYLGGLVGMAIVKACDLKLARYAGGSAREDEEALQGASKRLKCAITIRLEEKRSLMALKKAVIDTMGGGEEEEEDSGDAEPGRKKIKL